MSRRNDAQLSVALLLLGVAVLVVVAAASSDRRSPSKYVVPDQRPVVVRSAH